MARLQTSPPARRGGGLVPDPAARGAIVRRVPGHGEDEAERLMRVADRFNGSREAKKMRGLARSLGRPEVSVGAGARIPGQVRVTVAWELCWYQWGVDPDVQTESVYELNHGEEIDELDWAARQWNAHLTRRGALRLGPPNVRR
jgi:hypothetical protein